MSKEDNKDIKSPTSNITIPWLKQEVSSFLHKNILIFGGTHSGKTTIVNHILWLLQFLIPNFLIIVPESGQKFYSDKLPAVCIKSELTKEMLDGIWARQELARKIYEAVNVQEKLLEIAKLSNDAQFDRDCRAIEHVVENEMKKLDNSNIEYGELKDKKIKLNEAKDKKIKDICRSTIRKNKDRLLGMKIGEENLLIVKCLDFNPNFMLIIDDCTERLKAWQKFYPAGTTNIFEALFFRGRHLFVTSAIVAHDDKFLSPELRKGARMVIFTQSQVFLAATGKDSVGFSNQEKKDVQEISKLVFGDDAKVTSLKKVCYDRESVPPFKYFIADKHDSFKLGGQAVWEFAAKIPSQKEGLDKKTLNHLLGIQKPAWSSSPTIKW